MKNQTNITAKTHTHHYELIWGLIIFAVMTVGMFMLAMWKGLL